MRNQHPCIVPDAASVRRCDARDIADEVVERIRSSGQPRVLFLLPDGEAKVVSLFVWQVISQVDSLVGVYDERATATEILDDILAMERLH